MGKLSISMPKDFEEKLSKLGEKTEEIVGKSLKAGAQEIKKAMQTEAKAVIGEGTKYESRSTGELERSIGISPVMVDHNGIINVRVGFNEPRRKQTADAHKVHKRKGKSTSKRSYNQTTNAMIAATIEYGKTGQSPKPFMAKAKKKSKKAAEDAAIDVFDSEVNKL